MTETPQVVQIARRGRAHTVEITDQVTLDLAKAWVRAWDALSPEFEAALARLEDAQPGDVIGAAQMARDRRIMQALARAQDTLDDLAATTHAAVSADITPIVLAAADVHYEQLAAQLPEGAPGRLGLGVLDPVAVDEIVARTVDRIEAATLALPVVTAELMKAELIRGVTVGANPRAVARQIMARTQGQFMGGLARAERIARTELLDAHRGADQAMAERNANVIAAAVWVATLDRRTCPSCLAKHGDEYPPDTFGPEDHVQGRCTFVYRTKTAAELGFVGVKEPPPTDYKWQRDTWFDNLTEDSQDAILGKGRADFLRAGGDWSALSTRRENPEWRAHHVSTPVRDLPTG